MEHHGCNHPSNHNITGKTIYNSVPQVAANPVLKHFCIRITKFTCLCYTFSSEMYRVLPIRQDIFQNVLAKAFPMR